MALLNRLFPSRKKSHKPGYVTFGKNETESWKPFNFSKEQVRVLLFRECDWRGRKLLFDSKAVQKVPLDNHPCSKLKFGSRQKPDNKKTDTYVEVTNGFGYQYMRPNSDVTVLGEMVFGSVAMAFQGTVFKVHSMKSPSRLMCTKVFHSRVTGARSRGVSDRSLEDSCGSSINSMSEYFTSQGSCPDTRQASPGSGPLDIELRTKHYNSLEVDSGFCGDASLHSTSSVGSGCYSSGGLGTYTSSPDSRRSSGSFLNNPVSCHSGGSLASLQRRWLRNMSTSLELGLQGSPWSSRSTMNDLPNEDISQPGHRRTKLGLAVVISLTPEEEKEMHSFFFEHMTVVEGMMERLHSSVEHAYLHKEMFVHLMMEGCLDMQQWLLDVFSAPRLTFPVWLGLTSGLNHLNSALSYSFLQDLCHLIANIDTKATNFFVSTLVTAVLTHHLGWVATILPGKMPPHHISKKHYTGQLLDALSKSHPYNPLWAQLGELCGALGFPMKIAKTIVTSGPKKVELLNKILSSLTYFVRCSEVEKRVIEKQDSTEEQLGELSAATSWQSSNTSGATLINEDSPFKRSFLSGHDMMTVFDNRVDHGVEIGRELQVENGVCPSPDKCSDKSSPLPSKAVKDHYNSVQNVDNIEEHGVSGAQNSVLIGQLSVGENVKDFRKDVHLLVPQEGGMKRTASFMKRLDNAITATELEHSNPTSSRGAGRLYPNLADLKLVEDETRDSNFSLRREEKSSVADLNLVENGNIKNDISFHHEDISRKVSRLCRVPTSAILYHLQNKDGGKEVKIEGMLLPKRVESERQRSSVKTVPIFKANNWPGEVSENSKNPSSMLYTLSCEKISEDGGSRSGKSDVIFVIGDNEQLVDLKQSQKSENELNEKSVSNSKKSFGHDCPSSLHVSPTIVCEQDGNSSKLAPQANHSSVKTSARGHEESEVTKKLKLNINLGLGKCEFKKEAVNTNVPTKDQETVQCTTCNTSNNGYQVVTVRPSVIELEDECGGLKTDLSIGNPVRTRKPVSRSLSLSSSLSGERVGKNVVSLCRRHSDCVCETSRYLKDYHSVRFHFERCEGVLMNYIEGRDQNKSLNQIDQKTDKVTEARENFCSIESSVVCEKCSFINQNILPVGCRSMTDNTLLDKTNEHCDTCVIRGEKRSDCSSINKLNHYVSEGNAIFEDYSNLSDDDVMSDTNIKAEEDDATPTEQQQSLLKLSMPRCRVEKHGKQMCGFAASLMGSTSDHYIPDMVLQGCIQLPKGWETNLRRDLSLAAHHPLLDQEVSEAVCIVANIDTWEVQLVSSHTYVVDKPGTLGVRVGMSRLVANMLESLLYLWRLKTSPEHCLLHLESKLRELFLRSQAVAELLLTTEFCDMELLTTSLDLDANDVPLLLAVASTHTPQVTERYGLSFR